MNIHDFEVDEEVPKNIWPSIFEKQMALAIKYKDIEGMGTLLDTTSTNVDTAVGQKFIKDFAWRVTEELTEAIEAFRESKSNIDDATKNEAYLHFQEELIDALHFLTELTIIAGHDSKIIENTAIANKYDWQDIVYFLGLMCNCLKNKPWKQSQMLTDRPKFDGYLKLAWSALYDTLRMTGLHDEDIFNLYFKKNKVNQFRQRSNY